VTGGRKSIMIIEPESENILENKIFI